MAVWGGHKGSGLALVVQLLGMLAGQAAAPQGLTDCGFLLLVIDPDLLTSAEEFQHKVAEYAESVSATRPWTRQPRSGCPSTGPSPNAPGDSTPGASRSPTRSTSS